MHNIWLVIVMIVFYSSTRIDLLITKEQIQQHQEQQEQMDMEWPITSWC